MAREAERCRISLHTIRLYVTLHLGLSSSVDHQLNLGEAG